MNPWTKEEAKTNSVNDNVVLKEGYKQVVVWTGTDVPKDDVEGFESWFLSMNIRVQFLEIITTGPDHEGCTETGGRVDAFFAIHSEDIERMAQFKLRMTNRGESMRWVEDVLSDLNYRNIIYPSRVQGYMSWNPNGAMEDAFAKTMRDQIQNPN